MAPLLLLLLAAGGVALIAKSSSSGGGARVEPRPDRLTDVTSTLDSVVVTAKDEKFMDPLYLVFGKVDAAGRRTYAIAPWNQRPHNGIGGGLDWLFNRWSTSVVDVDAFGHTDDAPTVSAGYEYLEGVPYTAEARIKAMRAMINERAKNPGALSPERSVILKPMREIAAPVLFEMNVKLTESYMKVAKSATAAGQYAAALGVDTSTLVAEAKSMLAGPGAAGNLVSATLKSYGPMAQTFVNSGLQAFDLLTTDGGTTTETVKWLQIAEKVSLYIPLVGNYASALIGMAGGILQSELEDNLKACNSGIAGVAELYNKLMAERIPVPFHAYQIFHGTCGKDNVAPASLGWLDTLFLRLLWDWNALPTEMKVSSIRWMGAATIYGSLPEAAAVFDNLGFDASGGMIASDEQVMLVAAPIAVANGIDIDTFATALWKKSKGWRGAATEKAIPKDRLRHMCEGNTCTIPTNAWVLQWCQLTQEATELAASWPRAVPAEVAVPAAAPAVLSAESVKLGTEAFKAAEGLKLPGGLKF